MYVNGNNVTHSKSFGVKQIPEEINRFIGNNRFLEQRPVTQ